MHFYQDELAVLIAGSPLFGAAWRQVRGCVRRRTGKGRIYGPSEVLRGLPEGVGTV